MAVTIIDSLTPLTFVPISYGMKLSMEYSGNIAFRNKLGVDIWMDDEYIGTVEIDIDTEDIPYFLDLGIIKQYIVKRDTPADVAGMVSDSTAAVVLKPFSRSRDQDSAWTDKQYGTDSSFHVVRGVNRKYYITGDKTPTYPGGSDIFNRGEGSYTLEIPNKHWEMLYFPLPDTYDGNSVGIEGKVEYWGNMYSNPDGAPTKLEEHDINLQTSSYARYRTAYINITKPEVYAADVKYIKLKFKHIEYDPSDDIELGDWDITVNYVCTPTWDFQLSLLYIDHTFNWSSVPFFVKNENTLTRSVNTLEGYDFSKHDQNLRVRRVFKLKSDYLSKHQIDAITTLGVTPNVNVKLSEATAPQEARLLSSEVLVVSHNNNPMYQLEIDVELSELVLTP